MNCRELVELFAAEAKLFTLEFEARGKLSSQEIKLGDCPLQLDFDLSMLSHDSRKLEPKSAFFALPGRTVDGCKYLPQAIAKGAALLIAEADPSALEKAVEESPSELRKSLEQHSGPLFYLQVENARQALAIAAAAYYGRPAEKIKIIGITGTKGKSSVAHLLTQLLTLSGHRVLLIGTTGIHFANEHKITDNTTPESLVIQEAMADALAKGATHLVIELSSQALAMQRSYGLQPDLACFLNLSPDHIGALEHPDFADYLNSKLKVFKGAKNCLFNLDDPAAAKLLKAALEALPKKQAGQLAAFGFGSPQELEQGLSRIAREAGFQGAELEEVLTRVQLYGGEELKFTSQNLSFIFQQKQISLEPAAAFLAANALATLASLDLLGELNEDLIAAIAKLHVPGRLEKIKTSKGAVIVIDYAHNELSLEALLAALKPQVKGRLLVLFGSVGEKSKERRRELPRVAERYADFVYVSSDNPGFEDPEKIVQEIGAQFSPDFKNYDLEADRELAIRRAVRSLRAGDLLVLAGKGHEKFQLVKGEHLAFDERAIVESELAAIAEDLKA